MRTLIVSLQIEIDDLPLDEREKIAANVGCDAADLTVAKTLDDMRVAQLIRQITEYNEQEPKEEFWCGTDMFARFASVKIASVSSDAPKAEPHPELPLAPVQEYGQRVSVSEDIVFYQSRAMEHETEAKAALEAEDEKAHRIARRLQLAAEEVEEALELYRIRLNAAK